MPSPPASPQHSTTVWATTKGEKQCIIDAPDSRWTSVKMTYWRGGGGAKNRRTVISIPEIPSPSPEAQDKFDFHGRPPKKKRLIADFQKLRKQRLALF